MTGSNETRAERRKYSRSSPKGTVVVYAGAHLQARLANIGGGGMLVTTTVAAPADLLDRTIEVELRFDGRTAEWLRASVRVCRLTADSIAMAFDDISPQLRREIDEMSATSQAHRRVMNVVLVDADPARRAAMLEAFGAAGCMVVEASTTLEAIVRLGESRFEPDLIAIGDSVSSTASQLRIFVEREHPNAKLVAIGDQLIEPVGSANWLSSADPAADLVKRVSEMLGRPRRV